MWALAKSKSKVFLLIFAFCSLFIFISFVASFKSIVWRHEIAASWEFPHGWCPLFSARGNRRRPCRRGAFWPCQTWSPCRRAHGSSAVPRNGPGSTRALQLRVVRATMAQPERVPTTIPVRSAPRKVKSEKSVGDSSGRYRPIMAAVRSNDRSIRAWWTADILWAWHCAYHLSKQMSLNMFWFTWRFQEISEIGVVFQYGAKFHLFLGQFDSPTFLCLFYFINYLFKIHILLFNIFCIGALTSKIGITTLLYQYSSLTMCDLKKVHTKWVVYQFLG